MDAENISTPVEEGNLDDPFDLDIQLYPVVAHDAEPSMMSVPNDQSWLWCTIIPPTGIC